MIALDGANKGFLDDWSVFPSVAHLPVSDVQLCPVSRSLILASTHGPLFRSGDFSALSSVSTWFLVAIDGNFLSYQAPQLMVKQIKIEGYGIQYKNIMKY